jgi:hypothetical protein
VNCKEVRVRLGGKGEHKGVRVRVMRVNYKGVG